MATKVVNAAQSKERLIESFEIPLWHAEMSSFIVEEEKEVID